MAKRTKIQILRNIAILVDEVQDQDLINEAKQVMKVVNFSATNRDHLINLEQRMEMSIKVNFIKKGMAKFS